SSASPESPALRDSLLNAYREVAKETIAQRLPLFAARLGAWPRQWRIKAQRRRWGSCSPRGILNFNWRLILAPPGVLDYVVAHELCHLKHPDHSARFWAEVERICPDHGSSRSWLRLHGETLFIDEIPAAPAPTDEDRAAVPDATTESPATPTRWSPTVPAGWLPEALAPASGMPAFPSSTTPSSGVQQTFSGILMAALPLVRSRRSRDKKRNKPTTRQLELI
ncbi:MAG TPA: M48 family metallopeptidase, partial [Nitrospiria bacterium]|nr:M48 family metallopeptidase [Nitrospiria bacterium]